MRDPKNTAPEVQFKELFIISVASFLGRGGDCFVPVHGARGVYREVFMGTFFYCNGQLVESVDYILSESDAFLRVARLSYDLGCEISDIFWSVCDDWACAFD